MSTKKEFADKDEKDIGFPLKAATGLRLIEFFPINTDIVNAVTLVSITFHQASYNQ